MSRNILLSFLAMLLTYQVCWSGGLRKTKATPTQVQSVLRPKRIALLIGISDYKDPSFTDLNFPTKDVQKVRNTFQKHLGFNKSVFAMTTPKETTTKSIQFALDRLRKLNQHRHDLVVVYISGHGSVAYDQTSLAARRFIMTSDTLSTNIGKTALSESYIFKKLETFKSNRIILILATCFSTIRRKGSKNLLQKGVKSNTYTASRTLPKKILILSAASESGGAFELQSTKGDVYTHYLTDCMKTNKSKRFSVVSVHNCAREKTYNKVKKAVGALQLPTLYSKVSNKYRDIWIESQDPKTQSGYLDFSGNTKGGTYEILQKGSKKQRYASSHETIALPKGIYRITLRDKDGKAVHKKELKVVANRRQRVDLTSTQPNKRNWNGYILDASGSLMMTEGFGPIVLPGGMIRIQSSYFAARLSVYGANSRFNEGSTTQVIISGTFEIGLPFSKGRWDLWIGAELGGILLLQRVGSPGFAVGGVAKISLPSASVCYWFHPLKWGLFLQLSAGVMMGSFANRMLIYGTLEFNLGTRFAI